MRNRRLIAVVCIVVLLAAAMAPWSSPTGASIDAILVPLPYLFGAIVSAPLPEPEPVPFPSTFTAAPLPSRAPPAA